jgi:hypothetical protein
MLKTPLLDFYSPTPSFPNLGDLVLTTFAHLVRNERPILRITISPPMLSLRSTSSQGDPPHFLVTFPRPSNLLGSRCHRPGNDTVSCRAIRDGANPGTGGRLWIRIRSRAGKTSPAHTTQRNRRRNNRTGPSSLQNTSTSRMGISAWLVEAEMSRDHSVLPPRLEMRLVCSRIW